MRAELEPGDRVEHKRTHEAGLVLSERNLWQFRCVFRWRSNKYKYVPVRWDADPENAWFIQERKLRLESNAR